MPTGLQPPPDIAGDFVDVSDVYHRHTFFAHAAGGAFRSSSAATGMTKTNSSCCSLRHQRLVDAGRVFADAGGDSHAVHGHALFVGIFMRGVGTLARSRMRMALVFASLPICKTFLLRYYVFCRFLKGSPFGRAVERSETERVSQLSYFLSCTG